MRTIGLRDLLSAEFYSLCQALWMTVAFSAYPRAMVEHADLVLLNAAEVAEVLPMSRCIDLMAETLASLQRNEAQNPLRSIIRLPDPGQLFGLMPASLGPGRAFGVKSISVVPGNREAGLESHQGHVLVFESGHGQPVAVVDASAITAIRTAAVSGVATRLLAREDAHDLAILGSGTQARSHLEAMLAVRPITRVRAWSPNRERLGHFVKDAGERFGLTVEAATAARDAVEGADLVCTVTASPEPVLRGDWLAPGAHVNAVGSSTLSARELDAEAVRRARLFVDRRESTLNESGDVLGAIREGAVDERHIVAEIGELLVTGAAGRTSDDEITLFKSLGLAVEDIAAADEAARLARERGVGTSLKPAH